MNKKEKEFLVETIRTQYTEKQHTELDELKKLDQKVKRPAVIFSYVFGTLAALIMGSGMSLVMTDISKYIGISNPMVWGIVIGIIGMIMAIVNYPMYKELLASRKREYAQEIITLSDKIIKE